MILAGKKSTYFRENLAGKKSDRSTVCMRLYSYEIVRRSCKKGGVVSNLYICVCACMCVCVCVCVYVCMYVWGFTRMRLSGGVVRREG